MAAANRFQHVGARRRLGLLGHMGHALWLIAVVVCNSEASGAEKQAAEKRPPNLLFLMTDQHHYQALGSAGNTIVKTPHLDRLASGGTRFVNSFCVVPYCSPTRAAIVTGTYPSSRGLGRNIAIGPNRRKDPLRLREPCETYLHRLAALGYHCHQLGKWHLGDPAELSCFPDGRQDEDIPNQRTQQLKESAGDKRFDDGPRPDETPRIEDIWMQSYVAVAYRRLHEDHPNLPPRIGLIGRCALKPEFWHESVLADYCIELLKRHRDEPFAITYSISPPHEPFIAPARFYDMYDASRMPLPLTWDDRPSLWAKTTSSRLGAIYGDRGFREYLRCYYARVTLADECIGRILKSLDELGLAERTLVVFTSDHGNMLGQHGMMEKSSGAFYDDLMRVPLIARFPGRIPAGTTCAATASSVDLAPTILDCLGAEALPGAHGRSLLPFATGHVDDDRPAFGERGEPDKAGAARMIRTRRWKLCLEPRGQKELFDLQHDPAEIHNLADDAAMAPVVRRLTTQLLDHMRSVGDVAEGKFSASTGGRSDP